MKVRVDVEKGIEQCGGQSSYKCPESFLEGMLSCAKKQFQSLFMVCWPFISIWGKKMEK